MITFIQYLTRKALEQGTIGTAILDAADALRKALIGEHKIFKIFLVNNQPDALINQIYSVIKILHVSGIFFAHHQEFCTVHSVLVSFMQMNVNFVNAKQAKEIYQYRNTREKLYKTNAAIWYSTTKYAETNSLYPTT